MNISGGEYIAKMLQSEGVTKIFGIIDGTYLGFLAAFEKHGIELITPRHETSAAHMAGAYARLTGKLGVCIASNGPGVANILPGVAVEDTEGNRVMLITSSRRPNIIYPDRGGSYQCFNQQGVIAQMSKYSAPIRSADRIAEIVRQGFRKSYQGRPGVVHIDVPESIMNGKFTFDENSILKPAQYRRVDAVHPSKDQIKKAAKMLIEAEFPIIHTGSGVIHSMAFEEVENVANILQSPVTSSWGARGSLSENNDLSVPMIFAEANNEVRNRADVVLCLGSRMGETDWWGKAPNWETPAKQKFIQVDIDDEFLGRNRPVEMAICADIKAFLSDLFYELNEQKANIAVENRKRIFETFLVQIEKKRKKFDEHLSDMSSPMNTAHIANLAQKVLGEEMITIFDGGNTCVWGQFFFKCIKPNSGISTPKMGMLGAGVSQTLGAKVAYPDKPVCCIIGDGAFGFHPQEIETAVRNNLNVIYIIAADKQWGMVKMTQQFAFKPIKTMIKKSLDSSETINTELSEISYDKLAESMGAHGERVNNPKDLEAAIERASKCNRPAVIHVDVDNVKHMWAPGLIYFKKMHEEPKGK